MKSLLNNIFPTPLYIGWPCPISLLPNANATAAWSHCLTIALKTREQVISFIFIFTVLFLMFLIIKESRYLRDVFFNLCVRIVCPSSVLLLCNMRTVIHLYILKFQCSQLRRLNNFAVYTTGQKLNKSTI